MNIKILETKLQTILENDSFEITEKNINEKLEKELSILLKNIAQYNNGISIIDMIRDKYSNKFKMKTDSWLFILKSNDLASMLENEYYNDKTKLLEIIEEIFTNQELYDYIKNEIPVVMEIVDKLNSDDCIFSLDDLIEWFDEDFSLVQVENLEDISIYEYLNISFEDFNNLYVSNEEKTIVSNSKEGVTDEGTGSN